VRKSVIKRITVFAEKDKSVFLISGDAGYGVLDEFGRRFPDRYLNMGVAEQNMISFAAGLGLAGFKVFIYNIVPFVLYRCYEQVRNDICYQRLPVTLIGIGSGITYAPQGITHYAVEDIAIARTLPNMTILSPSDPIEAEESLDFAFKSKRPVYIRVAKSGEKVIHKNEIKDIAKPIVIREGGKVAVLFHGSISEEVVKASENIEYPPLVVSIPMIQPVDFDALSERLKNVHTLVTIEEHFVEGGLGSVVSEWITKKKLPFKLKKLGIKHEFIHTVKNRNGMRHHYDISADSIRKTIKEALGHG
jgi:transketolase